MMYHGMFVYGVLLLLAAAVLLLLAAAVLLLLLLLLLLPLLCVLLYCCCCCCCLLLLFVIIHLPPKAVLHTNGSSSTYCQSCFVTNEKTLVHPLAAHSTLLCGFGFYLPGITLMAITGTRGAAGRRQPAAANISL